MEDIDRSLTSKIDSHLPKGMRILGVNKGKIGAVESDFMYLLVGRKGVDGEAVAVRETEDKVFYVWRGTNVKELWLSGDFSRIVKISNRSIDGLRTDHQRNLQ